MTLQSKTLRYAGIRSHLICRENFYCKWTTGLIYVTIANKGAGGFIASALPAVSNQDGRSVCVPGAPCDAADIVRRYDLSNRWVSPETASAYIHW